MTGHRSCSPASAARPSGHAYGQAARSAVDQARQQVAERIGAPAEALVWTSGATESNNLALKGVANGIDHPGTWSPACWNTKPYSTPWPNWSAKAGRSRAWHLMPVA